MLTWSEPSHFPAAIHISSVLVRVNSDCLRSLSLVLASLIPKTSQSRKISLGVMDENIHL